MKEVSSSAVRKARPTVRKLDARLVFRNEFYQARYRRSGRPVSSSHITACFPGKR
jgi:hypothetical protein